MAIRIITALVVIGLILASFAYGMHEGEKNQLAKDAIIANGEFPEPRPVFVTGGEFVIQCAGAKQSMDESPVARGIGREATYQACLSFVDGSLRAAMYLVPNDAKHYFCGNPFDRGLQQGYLPEIIDALRDHSEWKNLPAAEGVIRAAASTSGRCPVT